MTQQGSDASTTSQPTDGGEEVLQVPTVGRPTKYPWDKWIEEGEVVITRDVDFDVDVEVMRNLAIRTARRRRIGVDCKARGDQLFITFMQDN